MSPDNRGSTVLGKKIFTNIIQFTIEMYQLVICSRYRCIHTF